MALTRHGWHIPTSDWERGEERAVEFSHSCDDPNLCENCQADVKEWEELQDINTKLIEKALKKNSRSSKVFGYLPPPTEKEIDDVVDANKTINQIRESHGLPPAASSEHGLNRRAAILRLAEIHINGDRADTYGPPEESFGRTADLWDAMGFQVIARDRDSDTYKSRPVNATDVALALTLLKVSRIVGQPDHEDSWVDAAGYIGLGAEIELNKKGEKR